MAAASKFFTRTYWKNNGKKIVGQTFLASHDGISTVLYGLSVINVRLVFFQDDGGI